MDLKELLSDLAKVNDLLMKAAIEIEKANKFRSVEKSCSILYPELPIISMSINCELHEPLNEDLHTFGLSFSISTESYPKWKFEGEVGWSSYKYGFEDLLMTEYTYDTIEELVGSLASNVSQLIHTCKEHIDHNPK